MFMRRSPLAIRPKLLLRGQRPVMRWLLIIALLVTISELVSTENTLAQTTAYTVLDLSAAGDASQVPGRLNNLGDLVGRAFNPAAGGIRATIWSHGTLKRKVLGALAGGEYSSASSINDVGEAAGASNTGNAIVPFIWKPTAGLQRVPLLPGDNCGQASGINKHGHVVGYSSGPNGARAFLWTRTTGVRNLGSLPGGNYSRACEVNDSDQVVGTSASPAGERAVLWTKTGNVRDLGTLPGDSSSQGAAINNGGDVVGYSKGSRSLRAFLWTAANGMQELGVLPGGNSSRALDINDLGYVVGTSTSASGDHAFIWTKQVGMTDLNSAASTALSVVFIVAHAINNTGQIVVMGKVTPAMNASGGTVPEHQDCTPAPPYSFLLTPTASP
jgi:probable HAF family extracellular repeat protein